MTATALRAVFLNAQLPSPTKSKRDERRRRLKR
ncbi:hypothetical protein GSH05_32955 [Burkholderia pseudomallei]|uniref:Uncharacterized protein n=3 Tax=pseudomallei group TaxID=111527 RepID=A0AAX1X5X2_BURML|nr:hypothetical protein BMA0825 [Burkholderia mallei ATCC 23344]AFR15495.1 hypothetical protein BPC006_I1619 [Burkholderia pseudomallei BPC006]AUG21481.1 hypothetical protein CXQ84_13410 [Burkholderia pseudomallei]PNX02670.1 hypothetical protein CF649_14510 [Burkholderia sp. 136(2017)]PNX16577.1 hypothetical protein CF650_06895 [Burkholderia sp. 129]PNX29035.1 hypothetical protein CF647_14550 [Burkholderia sp. 117]PNX38256.1 hypothetical protein CF648_14515 [Burkholderia sp. 137]RKO00104.1 h